MSDAIPPVTAWAPLSIDEAAGVMRPLGVRSWIAGGHAIDLAVGRRTREHGDIDIAMLRGDCERLATLTGEWDMRIPHDGALLPWDGDALAPEHHQFWVRRRNADVWAFEILCEPHDGDRWTYRRDPRITRGITEIGAVTNDGVPYLLPEIALLYKANRIELERNALDFALAAPLLDAAPRTWLAAAIETLAPAHRWLNALRA